MTFFHDLNKRLADLSAKQDLHESKVAESEKWIQKAVNPKNKGNLHKALHVAQGEKIPKAKIEKATHSKNPKLRHMAQFAKNVANEEMADEGNAFTGKLASTPKGSKFKLGDKEFKDTSSIEEGHCPSCDCSPCKCNEGNAFTGKLKATPKGEKFKLGNKEFKDTSEIEEGFADMDAWLAQREKEKGTGKFDRKERTLPGGMKATTYTRKHEDDKEDDSDAPEAKGGAPKKKGRPKGPAKGPERVTKGAWKHKGERKVKAKEDLDSDGVLMTQPTNCSSESIDRDMEGSHDRDEASEYGAEGDYVKNELHTMVRVARDLEKHLRDNEDLPTWCIGKLSQAKGMVVSVMDYIMSEKERGAEQHMEPVAEKAVSKAQRKFMGMAHAIQKGEKIKGASPELKKVAKTMKPTDTHDFAATKEKGLPKKVKAKKEESKEEVEETTVAGSVAPVQNAAPKAGKGMQFGKGVYEGFNTSVESMITETMNVSVNMNAGEDGETRKSITVSAEGKEADQLAALLKMAGLHGQSSEESCGTCGESECHCDETVEEAYGDTDETLNKPDWPTDKETLAAQPELRTYSGGLNGPKSTGQTTIPVVASQLRRQASMEESVELERSLFKTWKNYKG